MKKIILILIVAVLMCSSCFAVNDISTVNGLDRIFASRYNKTLDDVGTALQFITMATPAVLLAEEENQYFRIGTMYFETVGLTYVSKEIAKKVFPRQRPYTYYAGAPVKDYEDWNKSFPSGHTALAFSSATFTSYVFTKYHPESKWKVPVIAGSYALATATAVMRMASGNHFATDVVAGAILGTACGFVVPFIHTKIASENVNVDASPFHLVFSIEF